MMMQKPQKSHEGYVLDQAGYVDAIAGNAAVALSIIAARMTYLPGSEDVRTDHPLQGETFGGIESALGSIAEALNNVADAIRGCHADDVGCEMYQVGTYADGAPRMMYLSAKARARCDLIKRSGEIAAAKARRAARKAKSVS
jgi:hypothetical protein